MHRQIKKYIQAGAAVLMATSPLISSSAVFAIDNFPATQVSRNQNTASATSSTTTNTASSSSSSSTNSSIGKKSTTLPNSYLATPSGLMGNSATAQALINRGIANAKAKNEQNLETKLMQTDWHSIRTQTVALGNWYWRTSVSYSGTAATLYNNGNIQMAMFGDFKVKASAQRTDGSWVEINTPFSAFSLDQSQLPSPKAFAQMTSDEAAAYSMNEFNLGTQNLFITDDDNAYPYMRNVRPTREAEQLSQGIITVNTNDPSKGVGKSVVGSTFKFMGRQGITLPVENNPSTEPAILPDGSVGAALGKSNTAATYGVAYRDAGGGDTSFAATLKSTDPLSFNQNETVKTDPNTLVKSITDSNGNDFKIDDDNIKISWYSKPDTTTPTENGSAVVQVVNPNGTTYLRVPYRVKEDKTSINVKDSTIYVGDTWNAKDNFVSATDTDGTNLDYEAFKAQGGTVDDSALDTKIPGTYDVKYTLNGKTSVAKVTVIKNQTTINVHDSTIYVGDKWDAKDNFDSAVDKAGNPVEFDKITVDDSQKDTTKPGQFKVTYTLNGVTSTATITVKAVQTAVNVHDSTIYVGDKWNAKDNFDSAKDKDGNDVPYSDVKINDSKKDTSKPGKFEVTYTYGGVTATATITVKEKQTGVNVHDSTIYVGDDWKAKDNFDSALDKDGNSVDFKDVTVDDSQKDTSKAGTFEVTYTYDGVSATAKITVKDRKTAVNVHDSTIYVGDDWKAKDNFDSALDKDGEKVKFEDITVDDSQKDTSKAGKFTVTYTYDGVRATATITVKNRLSSIKVHDSTIYVGDKWSAEDNFDGATDKAGNPIDFSQLTSVDDSKVDPNKAGKYPVTYGYDGKTATATVTVKDRKTDVKVHDSTIYVGDKWSAKDNFDSATDKDGKPVDFSKVKVDDSQKNTSQAGQFKVTYTYDGKTATATITVKEKQTAINVHDSTIYVGDKWSAKDNFDGATNKDGKPVDFSKVKVDDSQKDTTKAGQFKVIYTYGGETATAIVTVKDIETGVNVHDSTITEGDDWKPADNFDGATDKDGHPISIDDVTVEGTVDTNTPGDYTVTYTYDGVTETATITVQAKPEVTANVDVQYVDENGHKISDDTVIRGEVGTEYMTNAKNIAGYTLVKTPKNHQGKFTKQTITVTYTYKKNSSAKANDQSKSNNDHKNSIFPQTGEQISWTLSILGVIILAIAGVWFWRSRKK